MFSLSAIVGLSFVVGAYSSIGPNANVYVKNKYILPDGFNRSYVVPMPVNSVEDTNAHFNPSTVLAGGTEASVSFPGPLIAGLKV